MVSSKNLIKIKSNQLKIIWISLLGDSAEDTTVVANVGSSVLGDSESGESVEGSGDASGESAEDEVSDESPETEESPEQDSESDESDESVENRPPQWISLWINKYLYAFFFNLKSFYVWSFNFGNWTGI